MPVLREDSVLIMDGAIKLYRRERSRKWQAAFQIDGQYIRISTGNSDLDEAKQAALPVVATSLAAEGMSLTNRENILIADGADEIAKAIAEAYEDEVLWNQLSGNALAFAEKAWGVDAAWKNLANFLADLEFHIERGNHPLSLYSETENLKDHGHD
jgi:glycosyltransferase involved in cell wall biosynthesis